MTDPHPGWWIFCLCVIGISAVSYVWLFYTTCQDVHRKLFTRQVQSLAAAGFVMNAGHIPIVWIQIWRLPHHLADELNVWYCGYGLPIMLIARYICILQETHISLTFFVQAARLSAVLSYINGAIPAVWMAGLPLGLMDALFCPRSLSADGDTILPACPDRVSPPVFVLCLVVSALSYFELLRTSMLTAPGSVRRRNIRRAIMYPTIAVISYFPIAALLFHHDLFFDPPWFFPLALVLELSNGFTNAAAYALQIRPARRGRARNVTDSSDQSLRRGAGEGNSFHVNFGEEDIFEFMPTSFELAASPDNPVLWTYQPVNGMLMDIRAEPSVNGHRTSRMLVPGETIRVDQQYRGQDGVAYLRLADGRGWAFASNAAGDVMCVPGAAAGPQGGDVELASKSSEEDSENPSPPVSLS